MLTYSNIKHNKRKDIPWLLFILCFIWICGTVFFHSPWEPYEPFVVAVVKGIITNNSWLVPYVSNVPYLSIQPFYFWIFSAFIKLFNTNNIYDIANIIRIINTLLIFAIVILSYRIGENLSAFKNGRTVVLILISTIGFINSAYQFSPTILILLGFCLYIYALQLYNKLPGISGWVMSLGLLFISINFTAEFIIIALLILAILPVIDQHWRNINYFIMIFIGVSMFLVIFCLYCYQLYQVNIDFFMQWKHVYTAVFDYNKYHMVQQLNDVGHLLLWYIAPSWLLMLWSGYKRSRNLFQDKIIQVSILLTVLLLIFTVGGDKNIERHIFPIILPITFIASLEIDSIRISMVSLLNWMFICIFGICGLVIWLIYINFNFNYAPLLNKYILLYTQDYHYNFNIWQITLAILITIIWLFMITRRHIRGRELITNFASSSTYVIILFLALLLPWFDSMLTFKPLVLNSLQYLNPKVCTVTNAVDSTQSALWYYYGNINLMPNFMNVNFSVCNQAVFATENIQDIDQKQWNIVWHGKRPLDKKVYYVLKHK